MANQKPKKSGKKPEGKPEAEKEVKAAKTTKEQPKEVKSEKSEKTEKTTTVAAPVTKKSENPMKGFFAKKYDPSENLLSIFKTPKIWGALIGELIGTMLLVMFLLMMGVNAPNYFALALIAIYVALVGISGAHFNPLITAGMMATRRMSAIRGILYMLAQLLGGWIGLIIINAFRLGSGTSQELITMTEVTGETFWMVALVELMGAMIVSFFFTRAIRYGRKQPLTFAFTVVTGLALAVFLAVLITQGFFMASNTFMFNPVAALMYQVLPTAADGLGELVSAAGLAIAAYILVPVVGGILGSYLSDVMTRLAAGGYTNSFDNVVPEERK